MKRPRRASDRRPTPRPSALAGPCSDASIALSLALLYGLALACSSASASATRAVNQTPQPGVVVSQSLYVARVYPGSVQLDVDVVYSNTRADTVFIRPCGYELQKLVDRVWRYVYQPICVGPGGRRSRGRPVGPREFYRDTLHVLGYRQRNFEPPFVADSVPGVYRVVLYVSTPRDQLPHNQTTSNPFRIEQQCVRRGC
jgi:hypothetical protein